MDLTFLTSFRALDILCIEQFEKSYNLPQLVDLKELIILKGTNIKDMQILANSLVKLERLCIENCENVDDVTPFIRQSPKLNRIKFTPHHRDEVLNLRMLNEERAKLAGARKIILYTRDDVFLATKWATKNGDINLKFIEMRRVDSYRYTLL